MEWQRGSETAGHSWLQRSAYTNSLACLVAVSLSFSPNVSFVPLLLFAWIIAPFQSNKLPTHKVLCVTVELASCVGLSGVELKPDIKHTTKQWSHENRMKLLWGSNREPCQTHTFIKTRFKGMTPQAPAVSFIYKEWSGSRMEKSGGCRLSDRQAETAPTPCPLLSLCTPCF